MNLLADACHTDATSIAVDDDRCRLQTLCDDWYFASDLSRRRCVPQPREGQRRCIITVLQPAIGQWARRCEHAVIDICRCGWFTNCLID